MPIGKEASSPAKPPAGTWVQTERAAHEAWSALIARNPTAARVMHELVSKVGEHNAVVISQKALADLLGVTDRTVRNSIKLLREENWVEVRQLGQNGTMNAYVVNDRVAWTGKRDGIRHSLFSSTVFVSEKEQPDREELGNQQPLRQVPNLLPGEQQLPTGDGLPPVSQPSLAGLEPDLPSIPARPPEHD